MISVYTFVFLFAIFMTINAIICVALLLIGSWVKETAKFVKDFQNYYGEFPDDYDFDVFDGDEDATRY
nr:MAG TPA: hypothetical protein [Caudoviricetes sp.]